MEFTPINVILALILLYVAVKVIVSLLEPWLRRRHPTPAGERPIPLSAIILPILFGAIVGGAIADFIARPDRLGDSANLDGSGEPAGSDNSDSGSGGDGGGGGGGDGG